MALNRTSSFAQSDKNTLSRLLTGHPGRLLFSFVALVTAILISLSVGARNVPIPDLLIAVFTSQETLHRHAILSLRLPRTLMGLLAGVAFGLSGAVMQVLTRNPLADPGLLGINAGATLAMVLGIGVIGLMHPLTLICFAFLGAAIAAVAVHTAALAGRVGATPLRLTLAGIAIGSVLRGLTAALVFLDPQTFDHLLNWDIGSLVVIGYTNLVVCAPFVFLGTILSLALSPALNVMALGDDSARSLGARVSTVRAIAVVSVISLTGAATAAVGPVAFVGLMVPHVARIFAGTDQRWVFAYTILLGPILMLMADIAGRVLLRPEELQVGIMTAFVGAPVLIWLVRQHKGSI